MITRSTVPFEALTMRLARHQLERKAGLKMHGDTPLLDIRGCGIEACRRMSTLAKIVYCLLVGHT